MLLFYLSLLETEEDRAKFTRIYESHLDWMLRIAFHYTRNETDAEDAVSDVLLNIISKNCSIPMDDEQKIKSYLFICIRNSAWHIIRDRVKHSAVNLEDIFSLSSKCDVEDDVVKKDICEILLHFIDSMPPIYKDVLTMNIALEKTINEIAQILNVPRKTVETRLRRGKEMLKKEFGDFHI